MPPQRSKKKEAARSREARKQGKVYQPPPLHHSRAKEVEAKLDPTYVDQPEEYMSGSMDGKEDEDLPSESESRGKAGPKVIKVVSLS